VSVNVPSAKGFAVLLNGEIVVKTVSPTALAARVNGLVVVFGLMVRDHEADSEIEARWAAAEKQVARLTIAPVEITAR
jgi:hypothetical protein